MTHNERMRLSGHSETFAVTPAAHHKILDYLAASRDRLRGDPDADETVRDLEASLGEHLRGLAVPDGQSLDEDQVAAALDVLGAVEPVIAGSAADEAGDGPRGPFWCRIAEGKWFAGICVGIAARCDVRLDWVRTIAIFALLLSGGLVGIVYLVLVLLLPRVATVAEYRRLAHAPVAARNIK